MPINTQITQISTPRRAMLNFTSADGTTAKTLIPAATAWAQSTVYALDARTYANGAVFRAVVPGTSSNAGTGPSGQGFFNTDGTVIWAYEGTGWGWKVKGITGKSTDNTSSPIAALSILYNGISYPLWTAQFPIAAAPPQALYSTCDLMGAVTVPRLPRDSTGTPFLYLDIFDALQVAVINSMGSGAGVGVTIKADLEAF
jgi:hypothetical protein